MEETDGKKAAPLSTLSKPAGAYNRSPRRRPNCRPRSRLSQNRLNDIKKAIAELAPDSEDESDSEFDVNDCAWNWNVSSSPSSLNNNNNNKNEQGINESGGKKAAFKIPTEVRETYAKWAEPSVKALSDAGVLPIIHETIVSLEQIPRLIDEVSVVADGARDFNPTPALVRSAAGKAYRPRRTLIVGYQDDPIDESDEIEEVLKEARSITRMKRPMVEIDVQRKVLGGGHAAPLLAPPLDVAERAEDLLGLDTSKERLGYTEAAATVEDLVRWLEEGNL
mmetsp:Transcript_19518/g.54463  ORF Transcript_19518/g.54463 Transcript_19518/m.54463 type:complete len:279 (+) Transcript_19518:377-1213(+)